MTVRSHGILGVAASAAALAVVVVATFVGVSLVAGGGDEPPPYDPNATPGPPRGPVPTQDPALSGGFSVPTQGPTPKGPESVEISGVVIPIPEGARYKYGGAPHGLMLHQIWFGDSNSRHTESGSVPAGVQFDEFGLVHADFEGPQTDALVPTLDALWVLAQKVGTPSPLSLALTSGDIQLPSGSYYSTLEAPIFDDILARYYVRFEHSVVSFDGVGLTSSSVKPSDAGKFQATLDAVNMLATSE